ncbi:MAG: type II toxin-antitoxin system VapC family toxin [Chloroflexi bacterium]|nr:type II toxin-antitoxin system VapC family toxin [Chloroflexota bacterium]
MSRYVLDSFALLAYYRDEFGAARVRQLLANREHNHWMSVINLGEVYYRLNRLQRGLKPDDFSHQAMRLPIQVVDANRGLTLAAAHIKAGHAMAYADCFAAALAMQFDAIVVTGDPEFEQLENEGLITVEWLLTGPKKRR